LLLLDTSIRASDLCGLKIHDVDLKNRRITVFGKGSKERMVPFSARNSQPLWKYLALRREYYSGVYLFVSREGSPLNRYQITKIMKWIGERASVRGVHPHRFRHTFAINCLRNRGNAYSLQMMLGHSTLEMVKTYLALAQSDLDKVHKIASPVDHWRL
jgi:integrase/recombinase XerD